MVKSIEEEGFFMGGCVCVHVCDKGQAHYQPSQNCTIDTVHVVLVSLVGSRNPYVYQSARMSCLGGHR